MKASELMLGDIITLKDSVETDKTPIPVKVIALGYEDENEAIVQIGDDETCDIVTIDDDFVGYPLTPEILAKNTSESKNVFGCWKNYVLNADFLIEDRGDRFCLSRLITGCKYSTFWICNIHYVHELQNALRLFGIEKKIQL